MRDLSIRRRLRDWVLFPALLFYVAVLVLASWVAPIRPSFLDASHVWATRFLNLAGIRSGHMVFHSDVSGDVRYRSFCTSVRGETPGAEPVVLLPFGVGCRTSGFALRLPPLDRAMYRFLQESVIYTRVPDRPARLERIGRHFCRYLGGFQQIRLLWYLTLESYQTGKQGRMGALTYLWDCEPGSAVELRWVPSDEQMEQFWGEAPWL